MIGDLIDRIQKTNLSEKDPDAEQMLQQGLARTPDALYILAQTVLVQKYALDQAQSQLAAAKAQIEQLQQHPEPKHASSFLGNLLGLNQTPAQPTAPPQSYNPPPPPPYAPVGGYGADPGGPYYGAPPRMSGATGGGGGFLQNAMQTAAGVAAGALAFQGIESLMHGFGHAAGYGGGPAFGGMESGMGGQDRPVENITNNYYDDNRDDRGGQGAHDVSTAEREIGNDSDLNANTADQSDRDTLYGSNDDTSNDTANLDDSSFDNNSSSFDDDSSNSGDDTSF